MKIIHDKWARFSFSHTFRFSSLWVNFDSGLMLAVAEEAVLVCLKKLIEILL